ncbi:MAG: universal stress protein [Candidatus Dormibacteraeota bacterium]|nr:universal stress protein [Candidatus Dormibacteraeota bacterium]
MPQPAIEAGVLSASRQRDLDDRSANGPRGRPHVILVIDSVEPGPRAIYSAGWLGRRLRAEMLVVAVVEYLPPRDELVAAWVASARRAAAATAARLVGRGITARGLVVVAQQGEGPATVGSLAAQQEADLVAVTSRRRSWFWVSPGSAIARYLTRAGRTPVLVIPDHREAPWRRFRGWLHGSRREASWMPAGGG